MELGLFPLGIVLLPTERTALHIFEPRYIELIGECLEQEGEFGLLFGDTDGVREVGTCAGIAEVVERLPDGRLNIIVEGHQRFRVVALTRGRTFLTAEVEPLEDEAGVSEPPDRELALERFRVLAELAGGGVDEPERDSGILSFELAARVDFGVVRKQELLELRSEPERLRRVTGLLGEVLKSLELERELAARASLNGRGLKRRP
jgi:Lon protease-like protein